MFEFTCNHSVSHLLTLGIPCIQIILNILIWSAMHAHKHFRAFLIEEIWNKSEKRSRWTKTGMKLINQSNLDMALPTAAYIF